MTSCQRPPDCASLPAAVVAAANAAGLTLIPGAVRTAEYCWAELRISLALTTGVVAVGE